MILILIVTSMSAANYNKGRELYFEKGCNGCHGVSAEGMNEYPRLANRARGFLKHKLLKYKGGYSPTQQAQLMIPFAQTLSDDDIDNITKYLYEYRPDNKLRYAQDYTVEGDGGS